MQRLTRILLNAATALSLALLCAAALTAYASAGTLHTLQYNHVRRADGQTLAWLLKAGCNGGVFWLTHASDWNDDRTYYGDQRRAVIDRSKGWEFDAWRRQYPPGVAPPAGPFPPGYPGYPGTGWGNFRFCRTIDGSAPGSGPWGSDFLSRTQSVTAPTWAVLLTTALLPAIRLHRTIARLRRGQPGHCPACGYDLRATPDRCPECGAAVMPAGT